MESKHRLKHLKGKVNHVAVLASKLNVLNPYEIQNICTQPQVASLTICKDFPCSALHFLECYRELPVGVLQTTINLSHSKNLGLKDL